jgi:hypothetical protein
MAAYNYTLDNFLATPMPGDVKLRIYDKYRELKYTITPELSYFFVKNNLVIIKQENQADIVLNFETNPIAIQALSKLNEAKKIVAEHPTGGGDVTFSISNLNMSGPTGTTTYDGELACTSPIGDDPISPVSVFINGVEANVGADLDCFFSPDGGTTKRSILGAVKGDFLHWNGSVAGFQLDDIDHLDFVYLIRKY